MNMSENEVLIIFGTETGNAEALADDAKNFAKEFGLEGMGMDMEDLSVEDLANSKRLLICCSTWGEGDQPTNAEELYEAACEADEGDGAYMVVVVMWPKAVASRPARR